MRGLIYILVVVLLPAFAWGQAAPVVMAEKTPLPIAPGEYRYIFETTVDGKPLQISYLLRLPAGYGSDNRRRFPMLVFFHGIGEVGTDLNGVNALGPMPQIRDLGNGSFGKSFPFVFLGPQCPPDGRRWETDEIYKAANQLVAQIIRKGLIDADRVYATGLSMGGDASWLVAIDQPDLYAAIAPLSPMACRPDEAAQRLKYVSVWCTDGVLDMPRFIDGTHQMERVLASNSRDHRFTYFVDIGHESWAFPWVAPSFYEWMLAHRRPSAAEKKKIDAGAPYETTARPIPQTPGHYLLTADTAIGKQGYSLDYLLYIPKGYTPKSQPVPAMLFLHEEFTIGKDINGLCPHGPDLALETKGEGFKSNFPFVVISPRLPIRCDWNSPGLHQTIIELLDQIESEIKIDKSRVIVTGLNSGALAAWNMAGEFPGRFAAIAPIMAEGPMVPDDTQAAVMEKTPGWGFVPKAETASIERIKGLKNRAPGWSFTVLPAGINSQNVPTYSDGPFLAWLKKQRRGS